MAVLFAGVTLVLAGGMALLRGMGLGVSPLDAMLSDYQDTARFRQYVSFEMNQLLDMSQKMVQGVALDDWEESWLETYLADENLLVRVLLPAGGGTRVVGRLEADLLSPEYLPEGYHFWMQYQDGRFTAWKDGAEIDLYGDPGRWQLADARSGPQATVITLAAAQTPVDYRDGGSGLYGVYWLLGEARGLYLLSALALMAGGGLLAWAVRWRRARVPLWAAAARWTGTIWLEVKVLFLLALLVPSTLLSLLWWRAALVWWSWILVHDVQHNGRGVLANSLCARLERSFQRRQALRPVQQRMEGTARATLLTHIPYLTVLVSTVIWLCWRTLWTGRSDVWMTFFWLVLALVLALPVAAAWRIYRRQQANAAELGLLLDQIASGQEEGGGAQIHDTDLARAWEQLAQLRGEMHLAVEEQVKSERMKVELISNVSHDLKTPITSILSYTQLLCQEEELPPHVREYAGVLEGKARRLSTMVEEVFEVSKAASGALELHRVRLDLRRLLEQTLADMAEVVEGSPLTLRKELPTDPVFILGDGDRLYRVFQNLIQNAVQYALPGTRVYLRLWTEGDWAQVILRNIAREELPVGLDFTERFVRGDKSRTDGGSGLGLAIARTFTEACGGRFQVEVDDDRFTARTSLPLAAD